MNVHKSDPFIVGVSYRQPSEDIAPALDDLEHQLVRVLETDKPLFLLGDLNFDPLSPTKPEFSDISSCYMICN